MFMLTVPFGEFSQLVSVRSVLLWHGDIRALGGASRGIRQKLLHQLSQIRAEIQASVDGKHRGSTTSTPAWTKLVNVGGTTPLCGLREFIRTYQAQRPFQSRAEEILQLVHSLLACDEFLAQGDRTGAVGSALTHDSVRRVGCHGYRPSRQRVKG